MGNPHTNASMHPGAARADGTEQWRKPGMTATTLANNTAAQQHKPEAARSASGHQAWYHYLWPF